MPFNMIGSIFNGILGNLSTQQANEANMRLARYNNQWQQQENERAFQRDLQMWDMQNQYNSPAAQRARIEAAGGNAMLAFGNGVNVTSGNATNAPSLKPATAITPNITPYTGWNLGSNTLGENIQRMILLKGQKDMQDADLAIKQQEARGKGIENDILSGTKDYQIEAAQEDARKKKNDNDFFEETKAIAKDIMMNDKKIGDKSITKLSKEIDNLETQHDLLKLEYQAKEILNTKEFIYFDRVIMPLLNLFVPLAAKGLENIKLPGLPNLPKFKD